MPDYTAMGDVLKNVASEGRFLGKDVVTWLRLVMDTTDKIKVQAELDIVIPHIDVNAEYTKANVMGLFKGITTKKEVVRYVLRIPVLCYMPTCVEKKRDASIFPEI